jgi:hypothetical protein
MGVVGLHDSVVLNLERGPNRLAFVVTESFGGWGFTARTEPLRDEPIVLAEGVEKVWELREGLAMPESAAWDPEREIFYVSNMNPGSASGASAGGYVVRVHADGHALEGKWVEGLRAPTGIAVHGSRLYAVERPGVVVVDLDSGEIIERRAVEATGGFLNDLAVVDDQTLFISDSASGVIYRWKSGEVTRWLEDDAVAGVNGLVVDAGRLVATAMGSENLVTIDLETGRIERIVDLQPFGGDGVVLDGRGGLLVSDYRGRLLRITPSGAFDQLIDARDAGISLTDFAFAPTVDLVAVPTLRGGALLGFRLGAAEE